MTSPLRLLTRIASLTCAVLIATAPAQAQVHYDGPDHPWGQRAGKGPDAEVDGWYYNLGLSGMRASLVEDHPTHLLVKHVFEGTPADGKVRPGDYIIGAGGEDFETPHRNGYGMEVFGPQGPLLDFAIALEACQSKKGKGRLDLELLRGEKTIEVTLKIDRKYGTYGKSYPDDCKKSDRILDELLDYLVENQRPNGSFGIAPHNTFAPLALLASDKPKHQAAAKRNVKWHAKSTSADEVSSLINWRYMAAAIVMSEYYLATGEKWVLPELQEVYTLLHANQYTDLSQVSDGVQFSHPDALPKDAMAAHGGWGHNPGFEGYGPIAMLTAQGALAFSLMARCGIEVDAERHKAAYAFLARGTGKNGYTWYGDEAASQKDWADMGRTGASGIANHLSPFKGSTYKRAALTHASVIAEHPESFPDTHGSPIMGMGYAALAANVEAKSFRALMDANSWWFTLSQCTDGTFYYQPNRDNAGYGGDSRLAASAVTAFIFSIPKANLLVTGKRSR